jgi:small-conductance mechanosensitive channel
VALVAVGAFLILAEFGFNIAPVVAGVGITGIALGLGAQTLVKDAINGLFILGENQFGRGDVVTLANVTGRVEDVNLRRTVLRAEDGTVYVVPNSAISVTANHTRGYSGVSFPVAISYKADLETAIREIARIGRELAEDPEWGLRVIEAPYADRVDSLEDVYLNLHVTGKAAPGAGVRVSSEMRRRIKEEFDRLGIAYRGGPAAQPQSS